MTETRKNYSHMSLDICGCLHNWDDEVMEGVFLHDDGRKMTIYEAKQSLMDELLKGHTVIPCCDSSECPDFDYTGDGCPGHEEVEA